MAKGNLQQSSSKSSGSNKKILIGIMAVVVIAIVVIVVVLLLGGSGKGGGGSGGPKAGDSPTDIFLASNQEMNDAENFDQMMAVGVRYATKASLEEFNQQTDAMAQITTEQKQMLYAFAKAMLVNNENIDVAGIQETIVGDTATVIAKTKDGKNTGTITLKKEDGVWRLEQSSWKSDSALFGED